MKKAIIYLFLLLVLGVAIATWLTKRKAGEAMPITAGGTNLVFQAANPTNQAGSATLKTNQMWARPPNVDDAGWAYATKIWDILMHENQPIIFYGRIVDQNDQPVEGVRLVFRLTRVDEGKVMSPAFLHMKMGSELEWVTNMVYSDAEGKVRLVGKTGKYLSLWSLAKDGYESPYAEEGNHLMVSYETQERQNMDTRVTNENAGVVFHLWKKGETEKLVRLSAGVTLSSDNHCSWLNIVTGEVQYAPQATADFVVFETLLHPDDPARQYDRTMTIQGMNGAELVETKDSYPYLAPESGYKSEYKFDVLPSTGYGPNGTWDWERNFYFIARNGKVHGGAKVGFVGGKLWFGFNGYLNPSGSRNLEPDPNKLITDAAEIQRLDEATRTR